MWLLYFVQNVLFSAIASVIVGTIEWTCFDIRSNCQSLTRSFKCWNKQSKLLHTNKTFLELLISLLAVYEVYVVNFLFKDLFMREIIKYWFFYPFTPTLFIFKVTCLRYYLGTSFANLRKWITRYFKGMII